MIVKWIILLASFATASNGFDFPERHEVCRYMMPYPKLFEPESQPPPFEILVNKDIYRPSDNIRVTIRIKDGPEQLYSFLLQARFADESLNIFDSIGFLRTTDVPTTVICRKPSLGAAISQSNLTGLKNRKLVSFEWTPSESTKGPIVFKATVAVSPDKYWVAESSRMINDINNPLPIKPLEPTPPPSVDRLSTYDCGRTRGCYRNPSTCDANSCDILLTWKNLRDSIEFQMTADTSGWVAFGLSQDTKMGTDEVFECAYNETLRQVEVRQSRNIGKKNVIVNNPLGLKNRIGWLDNGKISCSFARDKIASGQNNLFSESYHILLAKGRVDKQGRKLRHVLEANKYPYVSTDKIKLPDLVDITSTARYALVKVHGCLMVIGWMMCAMLGILLAKYYKPMWSNARWCYNRIWFTVHASCMVTCLICTVIGFILVWIHVWGYSQLPDYPDKAHPPLGITVTILVILNPLLALCRPNDASKWRPLFNWVHWLFGTAASVLATITLFIGLNLPKAHVPWWTTWIVVAFFLFHLIVELMLEIHGCLNSQKQEYRKQQNKDLSRELEPVGKNFKRRILSIYVFVAVILTIIVVISIAAG